SSVTESKPNKTSRNSGGFHGWWNKRGTGGKAAVGLVGLCCIGLILIVAVGGMMSPDKTTTNATSTPTATTQTTSTTQTPTTATISQLYNNSIPTGTYVKVTGTVIQSDGTNLRIEDSDGQDIMVQGDSVNGYEGHIITVTGTFTGPNSYDTAMGSSRTVPFVENAQVVQ
ncbi:MAG: hypothetical protein K8E24_002625, partial [Methanobacterium paludis]|nr:hypothetical protein [Methanobacterium paludis]